MIYIDSDSRKWIGFVIMALVAGMLIGGMIADQRTPPRMILECDCGQPSCRDCNPPAIAAPEDDPYDQIDQLPKGKP